MKSTYFFVFLGGSLGSLLRYFISYFYEMRFAHLDTDFIFFAIFPLEILVINFLGSFILGYYLTDFAKNKIQNLPLKNFFAIGFLGAFTTFSSFILDSLLFLIPSFDSFFNLTNQIYLQNLYSLIINFFPPHLRTFIIENSLTLFLINIFLNLGLCFIAVVAGSKIAKLKN